MKGRSHGCSFVVGTWVQVVGTGTGAGVYRWIPLSGALNFCGKSRKAAVSRGIFRVRAEKVPGTAGKKKSPAVVG